MPPLPPHQTDQQHRGRGAPVHAVDDQGRLPRCRPDLHGSRLFPQHHVALLPRRLLRIDRQVHVQRHRRTRLRAPLQVRPPLTIHATPAHIRSHTHTGNPHAIHTLTHARAHTTKVHNTHTAFCSLLLPHTSPTLYDTTHTRHTHTRTHAHTHFSLFFQTVVGLYTVGTCISLVVLTADFLGEDKVRVYSCTHVASWPLCSVSRHPVMSNLSASVSVSVSVSVSIFCYTHTLSLTLSFPLSLSLSVTSLSLSHSLSVTHTHTCLSPSLLSCTHTCLSPSLLSCTHTCLSPSLLSCTHTCLSPSLLSCAHTCLSPSLLSCRVSCTSSYAPPPPRPTELTSRPFLPVTSMPAPVPVPVAVAVPPAVTVLSSH